MRHPFSLRSLVLSPLLTVAVTVTLALNTPAADWPSWRGPDGLGVSEERKLPSLWSREENVSWKVTVPGKGSSSPIVVKDRVYLTTQTPDTSLHVLALDRATGALVWDRTIGQGKLPSHNLHNMATPTAVSDGSSVWVMFGTGDLACLNPRGDLVWQRNLVKEFGVYKTNHGYGPSPMLHDGKLFIACMHQGPSYLIAIDGRTGKTAWKKDRNLSAKEEAQDSYSSPLLFRNGRRTSIVLAGAEAVTAYNPDQGDLVWKAGGFTVPHPYGRTIAGLAAGDGTVVTVASGFQNRGYTVALVPPARGVATTNEVPRAWTQAKFAPDCPTPVVYQGKVYQIRDDGMGSCLDLKTGEAHWQERLFSANIKVSPVAGDGKVYFTSGQSSCVVIKAGPTLSILSTNELAEPTLASPAISRGQLFFRTEGHLYCIGR